MPKNSIITITLACIVAVVAGYFLFQLGSARLAQEENRILVEHGAVCKRIGSVDGSQEHAKCMGELNGLRGWHEQLRASIL
jgi:hypothetical protein